uniref:Secreted protein n=1 Tax=Haemonchus placei TaxID=6290 RepID=A0A0N4VSW5_HAEPC
LRFLSFLRSLLFNRLEHVLRLGFLLLYCFENVFRFRLLLLHSFENILSWKVDLCGAVNHSLWRFFLELRRFFLFLLSFIEHRQNITEHILAFHLFDLSYFGGCRRWNCSRRHFVNFL